MRRARPSGTILFWIAVLGLCALAYGVFLRNVSPRELWERARQAISIRPPAPAPVASETSELEPAPAPAPAPEPELETMGKLEVEPESVSEFMAEPEVPEVPAPAEVAKPTVDALAWLLPRKNQWPERVTLKRDVRFKVAQGSLVAPAGTEVKVVDIEQEALTVVMADSRQRIPIASTDLEERARERMKNPRIEIQRPLGAVAHTQGGAGGLRQTGRFAHPGCLSTAEDLARMRAKVKAGEEPWKGSWDILVRNTDAMMNATPEVEEKVRAGGRVAENYMRLGRDAARVYQLALRYHGSGQSRFAEKAIAILNAWAAGHKGWEGDSNLALRGGIYGYQFACGAELLRDYRGWSRADFKKFQKYMMDQFYPGNRNFLRTRFGTPPHHYWANWTLANQASMMAIGVLCDNREVFEEGLKYFFEGSGTENISNAVIYVHPNGLGQWQESGRDQGHTVMGPQLMGTICEIAWNQGIDLYGHDNNRVLAGVEYISKYNLGYDVPFAPYLRVFKGPWGPQDNLMVNISDGGRGQIRAGWDLIYNHYVNRKGLAAPYTAQYAARARPEGGGFNFGGNSGGFDGLGFTTLTHSRDPIAAGAPPSALRPFVQGRQITLSWAGSAYAKSYNVKRSDSRGGPYTTLATVDAMNTFYVDSGLTAGKTYYYVVSANFTNGESAHSKEAAATADGRLRGTVIGTDPYYPSSSRVNDAAFDGFLNSYFDASVANGWVGLDLGPGVSAVIKEVRYAPRERFAGRMKGGKFQGSDTADFSGGVVDLYTISAAPPEGELTSKPVRETRSFRYVRYFVPGEDGKWCSVAEVQFIGEVSGLNAPSAPSAPTVTLGDGKANVSWPAVPGADCYNVKRSAGGGPFVVMDNTMSAQWVDHGASAGAYRYAISAINSIGESPDSPASSGKSE